MIKIIIERKIQSLNKFLGRFWRAKNRETKLWEKLIWASLLEKFGKVPRATGPVHMVVLSKRKRLLDFDNLVGGTKVIIDAIKRLEIIRDDSPKHLKVEYHQGVYPTEETVIYFIAGGPWK